MKRIGVVVDNYKLEKFKEEFDKEKFKYEIFPLSKSVTTIKITIEDSKVNDVAKICKKLTLHFNNSN